MRLADAYSDLVAFGRPVMETAEAATRLKVSSPNAVKILRGAEEAGLARHLRRGLWTVQRDLDPFTLVPYLTAPFPAYVSLWSALAYHGMIEQIPAAVHAVSLDHTKKVKTTIGEFSIHHITPELFDGFNADRGGSIATPEKALFDTFYLQSQRGRHPYLPEVSLPEDFDPVRLRAWAATVPSKRLRTMVTRRVEQTLHDH